MLLNDKGQDVTRQTDKLLDTLHSKKMSEHKREAIRERILAPLREVLVPPNHYPKGMFSIEARARMV